MKLFVFTNLEFNNIKHNIVELHCLYLYTVCFHPFHVLSFYMFEWLIILNYILLL